MEVDEAIVSTTTKVEDQLDVGKPIQIVKIQDEGDHSFYLDQEALANIMDDVRIRDKPVCIVSVAGRPFFWPLFTNYLQIGLPFFQEPFAKANPSCWTSC